MLPKIRVYNTLTRKKEDLTPINEDHVKMYACGVTVYDDCHIGHAMQAVYFDVIREFMEYVGYKVTYVRNYTDVDDKIIDRANTRGMSPKDLAEEMIKSSQQDMAAIGVRPATVEPKVSESIPDIIAMISSLIDNGAAYSTEDGDVYYKVRKKSDYGKLSNRKPDELRSGTREIVANEKEDELDFALWKKDETKDASWESPWGLGRPGWHIECSAMSKKYLGDQFDIHGGGLDLIFPHHENEIAQSESANQCSYANVWMHSGLLTLNKQKMSKSLGNSIRIKDFVKDWDGEVLRLGYLQNQYSSNCDFSEEVFKQCRRRLLYFYQTLKNCTPWFEDALVSDDHEMQSHKQNFIKAMCDDFNTPMAIAELNQLARKLNSLLSQKKNQANKTAISVGSHLIKELAGVLGLLKQDPQEFINLLNAKILPELGVTEEYIQEQIKARKEARDAKNWQLSDSIRDGLLAKGIQVQDGKDSTEWFIQINDEVG